MKKKKCFGKWLDLDYNGYPECRICKDKEKCIEEFMKQIEAEYIEESKAEEK